jgi:hypothetical protein
MSLIKPRTAGAAAATLILAAVSMVGTSSTAAAYGQCVKTIPADHYSVSVTCPTQPNGSQFRVKTYVCSSMYSGCGSTPVYGAWVPFGSTSRAYTGPYVDTSRVVVETSYPV